MVPIVNMDAWYDAFNVKEGDKLYKPKEREQKSGSGWPRIDFNIIAQASPGLFFCHGLHGYTWMLFPLKLLPRMARIYTNVIFV
jgi:hypothetical protein